MQSSRFINLVSLQSYQNGPNNITFNMMVVTTNTAFYEFAFNCQYDSSTSFSGVCQNNKLLRLWNRYGSNATLINRIQKLGSLILVPYYVQDAGTMLITLYNYTNTTSNVMNTLFDGFVASQLGLESDIYAAFNNLNNLTQILFIELPLGTLSVTNYRPYLQLNVTNS